MRIGSQSLELAAQQGSSVSKALGSTNQTVPVKIQEPGKVENVDVSSEKQQISKEKLQQAVDSVNEFFDVDKKSSKFVLHDGLGKYYVRLVDEETEEVIKEIPPERLLDAFYEMQKLAGMIVDEKI